MTETVTHEDAVDLLDADHKAVKQLFIDFDALCATQASADAKQQTAQRICQELEVHAQLEEEIFYPQVRQVTGNDALLDEAIKEHAQAKQVIAQIQSLSPHDAGYDETVKTLEKLIDQHVQEEREQTFVQARHSSLDLHAMVPVLLERKKQLQAADQPPSILGQEQEIV